MTAERRREYQREFARRKRERYAAQGLTSRGTPRAAPSLRAITRKAAAQVRDRKTSRQATQARAERADTDEGWETTPEELRALVERNLEVLKEDPSARDAYLLALADDPRTRSRL
jgi:hypothetical protein